MTQQASTPDALIERLRGASQGYDEWRVQDPEDGSYFRTRCQLTALQHE